jgi:hypothetical protein
LKSRHRLGELFDKLRKKGYTIKKVAEGLNGVYSYNTLRNENSKEEPSIWVIAEIEKVFKKELFGTEEAPQKNYPVNQQTDNPIVKEDHVLYGDKGKVASKLQLIRTNLIQLTADVDEVLKEIETSQSGNEQITDSSKATPTQSEPDKTTFYAMGKKKSKKKDTDLPTPPKEPEE